MTGPLPRGKTVKKQSPTVALIDEDACTGCEVCIDFCPVDCILVLRNPHPELMSNVCRVLEEPCIGCKICVKECPWECIEMVPRKEARADDRRSHVGASAAGDDNGVHSETSFDSR